MAHTNGDEAMARLAEAITPGPWRRNLENTVCNQIDGEHHAICTDQFCYAPEEQRDANAEAIALLPALIREVLDRREAEGWRPETNILPWVALTIEQMRRFEASSGDLERLGLNGEWIPTDTPLSPGLVYRIKPNPTTEASHGE